MKPEMDPLMVKISPDHHQSSPSAYTFTKPKSKPTISILLLILASLISVAVTLGLLFVFYPILFSGWNRRLTASPQYSVIIDAGSSGSRVHVFQYWIQYGEPVFNFGNKSYAYFPLDTSLDSYKKRPEKAGELVDELVRLAKKRVPKAYRKTTEIRLMATAGMRSIQSVVIRQRILDATRESLRSSGFKFKKNEWASIISGSDEGIYAWIIANYAIGSLGRDPSETRGIVELGGASAQVTFVLREDVSTEGVSNADMRRILYGKYFYNLYSHSFQHLGQNEAHDTLWELLHEEAARSTEEVNDPCTPHGAYTPMDSIVAAGDFDECQSKTNAILHKGNENCPSEHCSIGSIYTPHLEGKFFALASFYYTAKFFELEEKDWLSKMIPAGKRFCKEEWSNLKANHPTTKEEYLLGYCFSSAYIISMLHDSLGFALDDGRIEFAKKAGKKDISLDWALGAFINITVNSPYDYNGISRKILA